jgi:hypothetical protein
MTDHPRRKLTRKDDESFAAFEDAWWVRRAESNEIEDFLSPDESEAFHDSLLNGRRRNDDAISRESVRAKKR